MSNAVPFGSPSAPRLSVRRLTAAILGLLLVLPLAALPASAKQRPTVDLQILQISDWHAQLEPNNGVGGAAVLSAYFQQDRATNPNTLTFAAGDSYGASPPLSNFFEEVPAILAMRMMGITADTLGNHNFDRGLTHLTQMVDLAAEPEGDQPGTPFEFVSANLANVPADIDVEPYQIYPVAGLDVAVIGITNPEAPTLVSPTAFGPIVVTDPVSAAMKARAAAKKEGADVFIVLTHMGITHTDAAGNPAGPLVDFASAVGGFDLILGDHTDVQYSAVINGALVAEAKSKGATYNRISLTVDTGNGRVTERSIQTVTPLASAVTPDPAIVAMLAPFLEIVRALLDGPIGIATDLFPRGGTPAVERIGEVAVGNLVTDAMRTTYGTQLAFTNGGGLRSPLPSSYLPADTSLRRTSPGYAAGPPYDLVAGDIFTLLPFGNIVVTRTVTGAQLWAIVEHSVGALPAANGRFGQISGFSFTFDSSQPAGSRVESVTLDGGTPIPPDATSYTFATNDFTNAGGDGYTMLADGQGVTRDVMANVVLDYVTGLGTITPTIEGRIIDVAP